MVEKCPRCGDIDNIEHDKLKGESWCRNCAARVSTNMFAQEIDFVNNKAAG